MTYSKAMAAANKKALVAGNLDSAQADYAKARRDYSAAVIGKAEASTRLSRARKALEVARCAREQADPA